MSQVRLDPTAAQIQKILDYLKKLPTHAFQRGSALAGRNAVQRLWWQTADRFLQAKVQGNHLYSQTIEFGAKSIRYTGCSCPQFEDCKHVVAALIAYSNGWSGMGSDLEGIDEDFGDPEDDEQDDDDGDQPSPSIFSAPVPVPPPAKKAAAKSKAASPIPDQNILAHALATRFGRKLTASEQKRTALIDQLYQNNTPKASVDLLMSIAGEAKSYRYFYDPPVTLWPNHRPPATVIEAWLYTAHALRKKLPHLAAGPLFSSAAKEEIERLIAPWLREEAIQIWQQRLAHFNEVPDLPAPVPPAFRLRILPDGAQIEWRPLPSVPWSPIKTTALRQHAKTAWSFYPERESVKLDDDAIRFLRATCPQDTYGSKVLLEKSSEQFASALNRLLRLPAEAAAAAIVTSQGQPLTISPDPARWTLDGPHFPVTDADASGPSSPESNPDGDYTLALRQSDNTPIPGVLAILPGQPNLVLTPHQVYPLPGPPHPGGFLAHGTTIPIAVIESPAGLSALDRLRIPLPARVSRRVKTVKVALTVRCAYQTNWNDDTFKVQATASSGGLFPDEIWKAGGWKSSGRNAQSVAAAEADTLTLTPRVDQETRAYEISPAE